MIKFLCEYCGINREVEPEAVRFRDVDTHGAGPNIEVFYVDCPGCGEPNILTDAQVTEHVTRDVRERAVSRP